MDGATMMVMIVSFLIGRNMLLSTQRTRDNLFPTNNSNIIRGRWMLVVLAQDNISIPFPDSGWVVFMLVGCSAKG